MLKVLALNRESHVARGAASLSVAARVTELLAFLQSQQELTYTTISEKDFAAKRAIEWADVLILSKHSSSDALTLTKHAINNGVLVIYDIDDWIFSYPSYSGGAKQNQQLDTMLEIINCADIVTVANQQLKNNIAEYIPKSTLLPNGMWVEKYQSLGSTPSRKIKLNRIVFTNADLLKLDNSKEVVLTALQIFFLKHPDYILDFYGDPFPEMLSLPFLHFTNRIPYDQYMRSLVSGQYQFSITPLGAVEDPSSLAFNKCKNPFKYLNYGCAQIPGLYSNASIYAEIITHNETGLLTENNLEIWLTNMERLATDPNLRARIRRNAFIDVCKNHHISISANRFLMLVKQHIHDSSPVKRTTHATLQNTVTA